MKQRDRSFDVLRWIALTGIILVHSKPDLFWKQLRSFDVPLMVLVSAVCFAMSVSTNNTHHIGNYDYYKKRFIRLVLPSWIFMSFYFFISYMVGVDVSLKKMIMCYTLTTSWYFWIVRILFIMALIAPWLIKLSKHISDRQLLLICITGLCLTELFSSIRLGNLYYITVMCLPYAVYYCIGMNLSRFSRRQICYGGIVFLSIYIIIAIYLYAKTGVYIPTSKYKYPPQIYYTSYALGSSLILYVIRYKIVSFLDTLRLQKFASFVGSHTFWIYLWHIPLVDFLVTRYNSLTTFIIVYFTAIIITYLQVSLVECVCCHLNRQNLCKYIKMVFIG